MLQDNSQKSNSNVKSRTTNQRVCLDPLGRGLARVVWAERETNNSKKTINKLSNDKQMCKERTQGATNNIRQVIIYALGPRLARVVWSGAGRGGSKKELPEPQDCRHSHCGHSIIIGNSSIIIIINNTTNYNTDDK